MRAGLCIAMTFLLCLQPAARTQTSDEAKAVINKAIIAMGLDKQTKEVKGFRTKAKGTLEIMGNSLPFTQDILIRLPDQFKDQMELEAGGMKIPVNTVFDGKKGWVVVNGVVKNLDDEKIVGELKQIGSMVSIGLMKPLLDKKYKLAVIGEVNIDDKPSVGIRVSTEGAKDVSLFFDKKTGLLSKLERQAFDAMTGQEIQEERFVKSWVDKDGRKIPHKLLVHRDGKKFLEAEVLEYQVLESVDASEFEMPK